jgi:predicted TIM-barrel fold metal-dependent hydrolase
VEWQPPHPEVVCNAPYILVGTACCLDQNANSICDKDEIAIPPQNQTVDNETALNETDNETGVNETAEMPRGTKDVNLAVDVYVKGKAFEGTTLFAEYHDKPRIVEVNMLGEVVWQYLIPDSLKQYTNPGFDASRLPNNNILFVLPMKGVYEIDRSGKVVWSYMDAKVSHDADRLANGNTLVVWGGADTKDDAQVKEVSPAGKVVWSWRAKDHYDKAPYTGMTRENSWTHANAATRLENGNTLISLRNFQLTIEVAPDGSIAWSHDWSPLGQVDPHDPELQPNGNLLACLPPADAPYQAVEITRTGEKVWSYSKPGLSSSRDCDRLPNGNTLIVTSLNSTAGRESQILEVTPGGEIVWQLGVKNAPLPKTPGWLYKAERIPAGTETFTQAEQPAENPPATENPPTPDVTFGGKYVDVHMHVSTSGMSLSKVIQNMDAEGIDKMILMEPPASTGSSSSFGIPQAAEQYPDRFAVLYGGEAKLFLEAKAASGSYTQSDLMGYGKLLDDAISTGKYKGFGEIGLRHYGHAGSSEGGDLTIPGDSKLMYLMSDIAAKHGVPIDVHMEADDETIAGLEKLLDHNKSAIIIWDHAGWSNTGEATAAKMKELMGKHPNLYASIKLRNAKTPEMEAVRILNSDLTVSSEWLALFKEFPDRFMIGSDLKMGFGEDPDKFTSIAYDRKFLEQLPGDILKKIERENAERIFKI